MTINVSILGLYNFSEDIFSELLLPDGIDKNILVPSILAECSDFNLLYPNYDFMRFMIGIWSANEFDIWKAMQESTELEYNPIENYDRYESITREVESTGTTEETATNENENSGTSESVESRTAFNSNNFQGTGKVESESNGSGSSETNSSATTTNSGTETVTNHMHGNIGVTTAQQMISGFREVSNFSVYDFIVNSFKNRFCIQIY